MVRLALVIAWLTAACGRLQFDAGQRGVDGAIASPDGALPDAPRAALVFQQTTGKFRTHGTMSVTSNPFAVDPTAGNRIVVIAWTYAASGAATDAISANDSLGNTYDVAAQITSGGASPFSVAVLSAPISTTGSNVTVTVAFPDAMSQIVAVAMEYRGNGVLDQIGTISGTAGSPAVSTVGATAAANETVFAAVNINLPNEVFTSIAPGAPYVDRVEENNTAFMEQAGEGAELDATTAGVQTCTWTVAPDPATEWNAVIATYR